MCHVEVIPRGRHRTEPQRFHASLPPPAPMDGKHAARPRVKKQEGEVLVASVPTLRDICRNHGWQYHSDSEEELEVIDIDSDEESPGVEAVEEAEAATILSKQVLAGRAELIGKKRAFGGAVVVLEVPEAKLTHADHVQPDWSVPINWHWIPVEEIN